jgi:Peptidase family C25
MVDKILITNTSALKKKYGDKGAAALLTAVRDYIAADKGKGLTTQLVDISDAAQMRKFKGKPVSSPTHQRQCKDAVDAIYAAAKPDYLVLLDGPDVVPHMALNNPTPQDNDPNVPSDLPYASDAPYTSPDPAKYANITRVVGRIPGLTGPGRDPGYLIKLLKAAPRFKTRKRQDYLPYFAISAQVWSKSTQMSVGNIFPNNAIVTCPPVTTPGVGKRLVPLSHFINCHGANTNPNFYGQQGNAFPIAMTSDDVKNNVKSATVVAAECCYGAQLYDPNMTEGKQPISNAYLGAGAVGFFGSSTIAYGPADGNSGADLITQYFLMRVLSGSSIGRACLQARQRFVLSEKMEDPVNLKTIAQYILLGDPSLQPCLIETASSKAAAGIIDHAAARDMRRAALAAAATAAAESSGFPGRAARPAPRLHAQVQGLARRLGFRVPKKDVKSFHTVAGANYRRELKARDIEHKVVMATHHARRRGKGAAPLLDDIRILIAHAHNNRVVEVTAYVRR